MENLINTTLKAIEKIVNEDLAALLTGSLLTLYLMFKYLEIPRKWEQLKNKLLHIDRKIDLLLDDAKKDYTYDDDDEE